jgi:hypothetical protein
MTIIVYVNLMYTIRYLDTYAVLGCSVLGCVINHIVSFFVAPYKYFFFNNAWE